MSKYTYAPVEHLSDLDITGATTYYLFEEGVGHVEITKLKRWHIEDLESMINDKTLFTREEKPWWERIPEKGVLCWDNYHDCYRVITEYIRDSEEMLDTTGYLCDKVDLKPLTNNEIKQFLQEEE